MRVQAVTHQQMKKHLKRVKMNCKMTINNLFKAIIIKDWVKSLKQIHSLKVDRKDSNRT